MQRTTTPNGGCTNHGNFLRTQMFIGSTLIVLGAIGLILQLTGHGHPAPTATEVSGPAGRPTVDADERRGHVPARHPRGPPGPLRDRPPDLAHDVFKEAPAYFENVLSHDPDMAGCLQ